MWGGGGGIRGPIWLGGGISPGGIPWGETSLYSWHGNKNGYLWWWSRGVPHNGREEGGGARE